MQPSSREGEVQWDARSWLHAWDAATIDLQEQRRLIQCVMQSTAAFAPSVSGGEVSVAINLLHLVKHMKSTTGQEWLPIPDTAATSNQPLTTAYPLELPLTPVSVSSSPLSSSSRLTSATFDHERTTQPRRRVVVMLRDAARSGVDALRLLAPSPPNVSDAAVPQQLQPNHQPSRLKNSVSAAVFHTSARLLLQTNLAFRLKWWASSSSELLPARTAQEGAPPPAAAAAAVQQQQPSSSGVLDAWFVPQVRWLRHGVERGFEWSSQSANTMSTLPLGATVDVVAISFDSRHPKALRRSVCRQRIAAVLRASLSLTAPSTPSDDESQSLPTIVLDVGDICHYTTGDRDSKKGADDGDGDDAWSLLLGWALDAAHDVAAACQGHCRVEVHPHRNAEHSVRLDSRIGRTRGQPREVVAEDQGVDGNAPLLPTVSVTTAEHARANNNKSSHIASHVEVLLVPPSCATADQTTAASNKRPEVHRMEEEGDEDEPIWRKYVAPPSQKQAPAPRSAGGDKVDHEKLATTKKEPPRPAKRLMLAESSSATHAAPSYSALSTPAAEINQNRSESSVQQPVQLRPPLPPTDLLLIEVTHNMWGVPTSAPTSSSLGPSSAFRKLLVRWYASMMHEVAAAVASSKGTTRGAADGPMMMVSRLRTVVFLCPTQDTVSPLLLSLCDVAHDEYDMVPYVLAIGANHAPANKTGQQRLEDLDQNSQHYYANRADIAPSESQEDQCKRLDATIHYLEERLPVCWERSILVSGSAALEALMTRAKSQSSTSLRSAGTIISLRDGNWDAVLDTALPVIASHTTTHSTSTTSSKWLESMVAGLVSLGSDRLHRLRNRVTIATAPAFGCVVSQLVTRPRRPEVAVELDRSIAPQLTMLVGVVRPPSSAAAVRSGAVRHTITPKSIRITQDERTVILDTMKCIYSREFRPAMDVLLMHRNKSRDADTSTHVQQHNTQRRVPYMAGYCPLFVGARRIRISTVVRRNLFVEVELNLADCEAQLKPLLQRCCGANIANLASCAEGQHQQQQQENQVPLIERMSLHLLPVVKCNCVPRIGEQPPRWLPGRKMKLCRHVVQVVCHFLDAFTFDPNNCHNNSTNGVQREGDADMIVQHHGASSSAVAAMTTVVAASPPQKRGRSSHRLMLAGAAEGGDARADDNKQSNHSSTATTATTHVSAPSRSVRKTEVTVGSDGVSSKQTTTHAPAAAAATAFADFAAALRWPLPAK